MVSLDTAFFATSLISMLAIINPLSTIGVFLSLTKNDRLEERHKIAFRSSLVAFVILVFFSLTGFFIFQIYGITVEAFRIAGGIVLFAIGYRMLFPPKDTDGRGGYGNQIYVVPLAIPLTSGPGAITTAVVIASQASSLWQEFSLWAAIFAACAINFGILRYSDMIYRKAGSEGIGALVRIMGLIVCAIAVQFVITGLKASFPLLS